MTDINECKRMIDQLRVQITQQRHYLRQLENELESYEEKFRTVCQHDWVLEPPEYQSPTFYSCRKCGRMK